ncbi:MAG: YkgJ family cysteine cluster protein [Anaerolineaceae bacterium]
MGSYHPCNQCGACCAFFRVSFYWGETNSIQLSGIPVALIERLDDFFQCMKGTNTLRPHCIALQGKIGDRVSCSIYSNRSSSCHNFGFHTVNGQLIISGKNLIRCNKARAAYNLPPISRHNLSGNPSASILRIDPNTAHSFYKLNLHHYLPARYHHLKTEANFRAHT